MAIHLFQRRKSLISLVKENSRLTFMTFVAFCLIALGFPTNAISQQQRDTLVMSQKSGGPWKYERDTVFLEKQSFNVRYGQGIYFTGQIHLQPTILFHDSSEGRRMNIKPNVTATVLEDKPLGNRLWLTYRLARQHLDYPDQHLEYIRVYFNNGESQDYQSNMLIPEDVTKISSLEIKWNGDELPVTAFLVWGEIDTPKSRLWWILGGAAIAGGGLAYAARRRRLRRPRRNEGNEEEDDEEEEDKNVVLSVTRLDPSIPILELRPFNLIRVKAVFKQSPEGSVKVNLTSLSGGTLEVDLELLGPSNTYISEPILLQVPGYESEFDAQIISVALDDTITLVLDDATKVLSVNYLRLPEVPEMPGIRITRNGPLDITVDPQAGIDGELNVRVIDEFDEPMPNVRVVWDIQGFQEDMPCSVTDEDGVAKLGFIALSSGGFDPVDSDLPVSSSLQSRSYTIKALLEDQKLLELVSEDTPQFKVDLVAPTFLRILNHNYQQSAYLVKGENTFFQVSTGRAESQGLGETIETTIIEPDGDDDTIELQQTPKKYTFENTDPWSASFEEDGKEVVLRYNNHRTSVPVYESVYKGQDSQLYPMLNTLRQINLQARRLGNLTKQQQDELHLKGKMLANAIAWLDEPAGIYQIPINVTGKYMELLELPMSELGPMKDIKVEKDDMPGTLKGTNIIFACERESKDITETIQKAANRFSDNVTWTFIKMVVEIVAAPHIGAYTAYTGRTIEGKKVGMLERFVGGVTAVAGLIPVGAAFARYAKAARAMERHALTHLDWYATTMEKAYTARIFAIKAATSQQLRTQLSTMFKKTIQEEQKIQKQAQKALDDVDEIQTKIKSLEDDIKVARERLDAEIARRANNPKLKPVTKQMESWGRGIKRKEKSLGLRRQDLARARKKHQLQVERLDNLHLGRRLDKKHLEKLHEEGLLPAYDDMFGDRVANSIYQRQVETDLAHMDDAWAGVTKRKIHKDYQQTRWGSDFKISKKKVTAPEADHIHMKDLRGGDSKLWTFWPEDSGTGLKNILSSRDTVTSRVRQAVNSIEKGRQVQYNILCQRMGQKGMLVWQKVWDLDFYIITPIPVPREVQNLIRASVGGAGRNIRFTVVPAKLDVWAKAIPD